MSDYVPCPHPHPMLTLHAAEEQKSDEIEIVGTPRVCERVVVKVNGKGNGLILGRNVHFGNVTLDFRGENNVVLVEDNVLLRGSILIHGGSTVRIGAGTKLHFNAILEAREGTSIDIGRNCLMSQVRITTSDVHSVFDLDSGQRINHSRDIAVQDHVWLSYDAMIAKGTVIGHDCIVGAKAMVAGQFPPNCVVAGNPARVIRKNVTWDHRSLDEIPDDTATVTAMANPA
ncbi:acyltransferase [Cupriavidus basilensis]